ncbi:MAG: hypothetical protein RL681_760 [Candidatus Parcubacteria bacterium]|jgi:hypothetical protein
MDFALVYIAHRFIYRVFDFFHHWYVDGSRFFLSRFLNVFAGLEQSFALRTTFAHFFEPLYKDYSAVGRILGIPFRAGRVLLGGTFYVLFVVGFAVAYIAWLAIPLVLFMLASRNVAPIGILHWVTNAGSAAFSGFITSLDLPAFPVKNIHL